MNEEKQIAKLLAERVADHQVANYLLRGISNTGRTAKSWKVVMGKVTSSGSTALVTAFKHVEYLNRGIAAKDVPYRQGSGKKSSKYIDGLTRYFISKGLSSKAAKGAAFATAKVAKAGRGHPADKKKLGFLELTQAQLKDLDNYENELTNSLISKIHLEVIRSI